MTEEERTTREKVMAMAVAEPTLNLSQIAKRLGVSRERVRQIVTEEGMTVAKGTIGYKPRPKAPQARILTGGVPAQISHTIAGTIGELLVAADLMARGYKVFFPLTRTVACDLITLDRNNTVERIEVRCGRRVGNHISYNQADASNSDRRAIVLTGEPVVYEPDLPLGDTPIDPLERLRAHYLKKHGD